MIQSQPRFVVVATVKDESPYLLEWLAWHRQSGVDHFVMFSNDCSDGTDEMLNRLAQNAWLEHHPNPVGPKQDPQLKALKRAFDMPVVQRAEWVLHFDLDEFLDITVGERRLADFVAACDPDGTAHAIAIPWRYMGAHGHVWFEDRPVTQRFLRGSRMLPRETFDATGLKTLFRPAAFTSMGIHRPKIAPPAEGVRWVNAAGRDITETFGGANSDEIIVDFSNETFGAKFGTLRHYAVKSRSEFLYKQRRGTAAESYQPNRLQFRYWVTRNINSLPLPPLDPDRLAKGLAPLRADPELDRLHRAGQAHMREQITALSSKRANARFLKTGDTRETSSMGPGRLLCLGTHHKTGTIWMRRVLRDISNTQNIPMRMLTSQQQMSTISRKGREILVHWNADFPRGLHTMRDARILHIIRDPRDVLLSGMRYHRIAPFQGERFLLETRKEWGGLNYQDYLNALPDDLARLMFEMEHKHAVTIDEMCAWEYNRSNTYEMRYEDMIQDFDCARFRAALEWANIRDLDIDRAIESYWKHSLFGGLADKDARDKRVNLHVQSGAPAQWETKLPREVAEVYAERFGKELRLLGYAEDDSWVSRCQPAWELGLTERVQKVAPSVGLGGSG